MLMTSLMHSDTNCVPKSSKIRKSVTSQYGSATDHRVIEHHGAAEALEAEIELSPADMSDMFEVDITRRETSRDTKRLRQKKIWTWDTRKTHKWYIYIYIFVIYLFSPKFDALLSLLPTWPMPGKPAPKSGSGTADTPGTVGTAGTVKAPLVAEVLQWPEKTWKDTEIHRESGNTGLKWLKMAEEMLKTWRKNPLIDS